MEPTTGYRKRFTISCTVFDVVPYDNNVTSCRDCKLGVIPQENPNCSNVIVPISRRTAPTGDRKKITKKVHKGGGSEEK